MHNKLNQPCFTTAPHSPPNQTFTLSLKKPKCPLTEEWIKKTGHVHYSAMKRNEIVPFTESWMDLGPVLQSEVSQKEKNKYCLLTHICGT